MENKEFDKQDESLKLSKIDYLILYLLQQNHCIDKVSAETIYSLNLTKELGITRSAILNHIYFLIKHELIKNGAKDEKAHSYYITDKGLEELGTLK